MRVAVDTTIVSDAEEVPPEAAELKELEAEDEASEREDDTLDEDEPVRVEALDAADERDEEMDSEAEEMEEERAAEDVLSSPSLSLSLSLVEDGKTALVTVDPMSPAMSVADERICACMRY